MSKTFASGGSSGLFLRPMIKNTDPMMISAAPKSATLSIGRIPSSSPNVKKSTAIPRIIITLLLLVAVECRANSLSIVSYEVVALFFLCHARVHQVVPVIMEMSVRLVAQSRANA